MGMVANAILEEMAFKAGKCSVDTRLTTSIQTKQLQLRCDQTCTMVVMVMVMVMMVMVMVGGVRPTRDILCVCSSSGTATVDIVGDIMNLFTVLITDDWSLCSTSIGTKNHTIL